MSLHLVKRHARSVSMIIGLAMGMPLQVDSQVTSAQVQPDEILRQVARGAASEVRFTETRTTHLLKVPLTSSGVLRYTRPDRLERETLRPTAEIVVIQGSQVSIDRGGTQSVIALTSGSPATMLIQTLRAVLSGDWRELQSLHEVAASGSIAQWTLLMTPKMERATVVEIRVAGRGEYVDRIEVLERGGDKTVTALAR